MKRFIFVLLLLAVLFPNVSAAASNFTEWEFDVTFPITTDAYSTADADAACLATYGPGYTHYSTQYRLVEYNSAWTILANTGVTFGSTKTSGTTSRAYAIADATCTGGTLKADLKQWRSEAVPTLGFNVTPTIFPIGIPVTLTINEPGYSDIIIDWGDGTTITIVNRTKTVQHVYTADIGSVTISVESDYGSSYPRSLSKVYTFGGIDFIATPTSGNSPLSVTFEDTSVQSNSWWRWTFGDGTSTNTTNASYTHAYLYPGVYSVRLDTYSPTYGYYNLTKTDYITSLNPSGITVNLDVKDADSGAYLQNVSVGIRNTTSGVWRNSTNGPWGCVAFQTTGAAYEYPISLNESITLAASAFGYDSASETFAVPYDGYLKTLWLTRTGIVNAAGTGTLSVSAIRNKDGTTISGISLALDTGEMAVTNTAGNVLFMNVSAGQRTITATDLSGNYQPATKDVVVTAGTTTMESIEMILEGETPRETYVAPTLAGDVQVDTDGDGIGDTPASVVGNYTSGQLNQKGSSGIMQMMGGIITLWPLILLGAFLKFIKECLS